MRAKAVGFLIAGALCGYAAAIGRKEGGGDGAKQPAWPLPPSSLNLPPHRGKPGLKNLQMKESSQSRQQHRSLAKYKRIVISDFELGAKDGWVFNAANQEDASGIEVIYYNVAKGKYALRCTLAAKGDTTTQYWAGGITKNFGQDDSVDIHGMNMFKFWLNPKGTGKAYTIRIVLTDDSNKKFSYDCIVGYGSQTRSATINAGWQHIKIPFAKFTSKNSSGEKIMGALWEVKFDVICDASMDVEFDMDDIICTAPEKSACCPPDYIEQSVGAEQAKELCYMANHATGPDRLQWDENSSDDDLCFTEAGWKLLDVGYTCYDCHPEEPDATTPDATTPDATTPDATTPDATTPDATTPDATTPDATTPDATTPDATTPDATMPETTAMTTTPAPLKGACCTSHGCVDTTYENCERYYYGTFLGPGTSCNDDGGNVCSEPCGTLCLGDDQCESGCCLEPADLKFSPRRVARKGKARNGRKLPNDHDKNNGIIHAQGKCTESKWCECLYPENNDIPMVFGEFLKCISPGACPEADEFD